MTALADAVTKLLTVEQAAEALRISRSGLYRLFTSGQLHWVQVGGRRRVRADEINRFIDANERVAS